MLFLVLSVVRELTHNREVYLSARMFQLQKLQTSYRRSLVISEVYPQNSLAVCIGPVNFLPYMKRKSRFIDFLTIKSHRVFSTQYNKNLSKVSKYYLKIS